MQLLTSGSVHGEVASVAIGVAACVLYTLKQKHVRKTG